MRGLVWLGVALAVASAPAAADPGPTLGDFYDRTRLRYDGFTDCIAYLGYCDGHYLAALRIGAETANPSTDELHPQLATGLRIGADLGALRGEHDLVRTQLWADVLRVNSTGAWLTDLGWHLTAFEVLGRRRDDSGMHLSFDNVIARRTEITPSDVAELQLDPYETIDTEAEVAPTGPYVDKDGFLALPIGVANRLRWSDGLAMERRTSISGALAIRAFPHDLRQHAQLDVLRVKHTDWSLAAGSAEAWTFSAGYQHLPDGIDTLPIWALVGYELAGPKQGVVYRLGGAIDVDGVSFGPEVERTFELDPRTATFARVDSGRVRLAQQISWLRWGLAYETVSIDGGGSLRALTPELGIVVRGLTIGARCRFAWTSDLMFPAQRFSLSLDWIP